VRDANHTNRGFSLIELLIVLTMIAILVSISMLILGLNPIRSANEASAIGAVRTLVTAERVYWITRGRGYYGDLGALGAEKLIDAPLAAGYRGGYSFVVTKEGDGFTITATPASDRTGTRSFFADASGVIRGKAGPGAGVGDPPVGN